MKRTIIPKARQSLIAAAMALGVTGIALAHDCSVKTLRGTYVFSAIGSTIVSGVALPKAIIEVVDFTGDGLLSVPGGSRSINGVIARVPPGGTGTYTVNADFSGTLAFDRGPSFDIYLSPRGGKVLYDPDGFEQCVRGNT